MQKRNCYSKAHAQLRNALQLTEQYMRFRHGIDSGKPSHVHCEEIQKQGQLSQVHRKDDLRSLFNDMLRVLLTGKAVCLQQKMCQLGKERGVEIHEWRHSHCETFSLTPNLFDPLQVWLLGHYKQYNPDETTQIISNILKSNEVHCLHDQCIKVVCAM